MQRHLPVVGVIAVLSASNLLSSSLLGLGDAEALYFCYSRHLSSSYLDHPPLIGWLIALATAVGGGHTVAVRFVPLLMTALTVIFTFFLTRDAVGKRAADWSVLLLLATPVFSVGMTAAAPDAPLAALTTLFVWQLFRQLTESREGIWPGVLRPLLLGLVLGLAFLAKYTGACLVLTTLFVLTRREHRHWLKRPIFFAAAGVAALTASPVLIWNLSHDWAGVTHRLVWTQQNAGFSFENAGKLLGGQLLYLGPLVVILFALTAKDFLKRRYTEKPDIPKRLLWAAALPTLFLTYLLCTWSSEAEPHWPAVGYLPLFPLTAAFITRSGARIRRLAGITVAFGALVLIVVQVAVLTPLVPRLTPPRRYEPRYDLSNELRGWPEVADTLRALNPGKEPVVAAFYTQCSQLAFALSRPEDPEVRCISKEIDDFDIWYGRFELPKSGAFFVTDNRFEHDIGSLLPIAKRVNPRLTVEITRAGRLVRRFRIIHVAP